MFFPSMSFLIKYKVALYKLFKKTGGKYETFTSSRFQNLASSIIG